MAMTARMEPVSTGDLINLSMETPRAPMHLAALIVLDGRALDGPLPTALREWVARRLDRAPRLRQVVRQIGGRTVWVDDPRFAIDNHLAELPVAAPGGEEEMLRAVAQVVAVPLPRSRPLWRMWTLTGLPEGRAAVLVMLHHAVADGLAAMRLMLDLLGAEPPESTVAPTHATTPATPEGGTGRPGRQATSPTGRLAVLRGMARTLVTAIGAPRTGLNAPVGPRRRFALLRLDLAEVRAMAHAHGGTINDVLLDLIAGGVRALLTARGEPVPRRELHAAVMKSFRRPGSGAGNQSGAVVVRLPVAEPDPGLRFTRIVAATSSAKRRQSAPGQPRFLSMLARAGILHWFADHQRMTTFVESNVTGPAEPVELLGAPVLDVIPIGGIGGNLTVSFLTLSYAGRLTMSVCADADRYPDLPVLLDGMRRDHETLRRIRAGAGRGGDPGERGVLAHPGQLGLAVRPGTEPLTGNGHDRAAGARSHTVVTEPPWVQLPRWACGDALGHDHPPGVEHDLRASLPDPASPTSPRAS